MATAATDGGPVSEYVGIVTDEAALEANAFPGSVCGFGGITGGRSAGYERSLRGARETATEEMVAEAEQLGADVIIGVDVVYESIQIGQGGSVLMVSASRTAVKLKRDTHHDADHLHCLREISAGAFFALHKGLTPPGTQYGATRGKPEQRKPSRNAAFAIPCTPLQRLTDHS